MRLTARTTAGAGAATVLLAGVLAGCGGGSSPAASSTHTSPAASSPAAAATSPSTSAPAAVPGGLSKAQLLAAMRSTLARHQSSHVSMDVNSAMGAMTAEGDVGYTSSGTSMRMTMQVPMAAGTGRVEMRLVDGVIYMAMPPMTPKGKFLAIDPRKTGGPFARLHGLGDQMNPLRTFGAFQHGLRSSSYQGREQVDGQTLDHYVLTVATRAGLKALGQQVPSGIPATLTYDLWLDSQHRPRKMQMQQSGLSMEMTMSRWGEKVQVTAPPKSALVTPRAAG